MLLIEAMSDMQKSGEASGYSQYLASMEQLTKGQQALNQGMGSLLPMPFGEQPGSEGLMQSLMQQQKKLTQQLEQLMNENSFAKGEKTKLKKLLTKDIFINFEQVIDNRNKENIKSELT